MASRPGCLSPMGLRLSMFSVSTCSVAPVFGGAHSTGSTDMVLSAELASHACV